jgi:predicted enzyme related to lactoylglutathione lyase
MIKQVKFASIPVKDQERALVFYRDKLGFEVTTDAPMGPGGRWIEMRPPGAQTGIVLLTYQGQEDRVGTFSGMSFECADVDATYTELKARGVEFQGEPQQQPWGRFAMLIDSEGNTFVMSSASEHGSS